MDQVQQQIEDARRILYDVDPKNGTAIDKSKLYQMYEQNAADYAKAKADYATAYAKARSDPMALQSWPLTGVTYQQAVDQAWDRWTGAGKNKIERALAIIGSHAKKNTK
jgi:hypothetical protein